MKSRRPFPISVLVSVCTHLMRRRQGFGRSMTRQVTRCERVCRCSGFSWTPMLPQNGKSRSKRYRPEFSARSSERSGATLWDRKPIPRRSRVGWVERQRNPSFRLRMTDNGFRKGSVHPTRASCILRMLRSFRVDCHLPIWTTSKEGWALERTSMQPDPVMNS